MKTVIIVVVVLIILGGGAYFLSANNKSKTAGTPSPTMATSHDNMQMSPTAAPTTSVSGSASPSGTAAGAVKAFTVSGQNFSFTPSTLTVNKGDKVKITFKNSGGMHDFVIDEFNVKTPVIQSGADATVEFTAEKAGTFDYYCSVGNHRQMGMQGTLIVK